MSERDKGQGARLAVNKLVRGLQRGSENEVLMQASFQVMPKSKSRATCSYNAISQFARVATDTVYPKHSSSPVFFPVSRYLRDGCRWGFFLSAALLLAMPAHALEFRSVVASRAVLVDAPSGQAKKLYVVWQGYPLEVIVNLGDWLKVRDAQGSLTWVEAKQLSAGKRTVLVTQTDAEIRQSAEMSATIVAKVEQDVVLELLENAKNGWVKVKHINGVVGYMLTSSVWGI